MLRLMLESSNVWQFFSEYYGEKLLKLAGSIVVAVIVLLIGWKLINWLVKVVQRLIEQRKIDLTLEKFMLSAIRVVLRALLIIQVLGILGIQSASVFALLGGSTLVVGLGLQGSLANFAGGMMILMQKIFQVGDYISDGTHEGTVETINIISTRIRTPDNKLIVLQNGALSNTAITNYSAYDERRLDFTFSVSYQADIVQAKELILRVMEQDERVLAERDKLVLVQRHGDSAVELFAFCWVKRPDYMRTGSDIREKVKYALDDAGIAIPYPQMDVHIIEEAEN